ncbi:MAG: T9SS type A sorting domain-containing protein, partial [Chitinophagales bacterium]
TATSSIEVIENSAPSTIITGNLSICPNENTILNAGANFNSYAWSNGENSQIITATAGIYTVTVSNANNCTATSSVEIILTLLPPSSITGDLVYCPGQTTVLDAGDYDAYVWSNGTTNRLVAASGGVYTVTVSNGNCSATSSVEIIEGEGLSVLDGSENFIPYIGPTGMDGFHFTVCGGDLPFDYTYEGENGFVSTTSFLSDNNNCHIFEVFYVIGSEWTMTITAENACGELIYTSEDVELLYPQIHGFDMSPETCVGYEDGSITVDVVGGDTSCGDYTYIWSGPSGFTASTQTITDLASGLYEVTIVDCNDKETAADTYLNRATGRGRGRSGCSGKIGLEAPTAMGKNSIGLYPNPFETSTTIQFSLEENDRVWLSVYGADGRKAIDLLKGTEVAANELQSLYFDAYGWRSGVYLLQLRTANGVFLYEKMVIGK